MKKTILFTLALIFSTSILAQWTAITPPPNGFRTDHAFGFSFGNTGYLVTGSVNFNATASFYSYDATNDQWAQLPDFPGGTRGFGIGDQHNGKAYFGFGRGTSPGQVDQYRNDLWEFDPTTGVWTELASCPCLTRRHPAMVASQGKIYVGLGDNQTVGNLNDWWEYDIANDSWTQKPNFPSFQRHHPYQFAIGNMVYVGFGHGSAGSQIYKQMYQFDPSNDTWTQVADIPGQARVAGTQFSHGGYGYALSGDGQVHNSMPVGEFWRYDATNDFWQQLPSHPGKSRWAPSSFVINDEVYLINGAETPNYFYPSTSFKYSLNNPVGLEETPSNLQFSVYPNPFNAEISIDLSTLKGKQNLALGVFNALGQTVYQQEVGEEQTLKIDLNFLEKGIYWVEISSNGEKLGMKKVIKGE